MFIFLFIICQQLRSVSLFRKFFHRAYKNLIAIVFYSFPSPLSNHSKHHTEGEPQCSDYDFSTPKCQTTCDPESSWPIAYQQDKIKFSRAYSLSGEANIMKDLYENGPMSVSYTVYQDFMTYKSGMFYFYSH